MLNVPNLQVGWVNASIKNNNGFYFGTAPLVTNADSWVTLFGNSGQTTPMGDFITTYLSSLSGHITAFEYNGTTGNYDFWGKMNLRTPTSNGSAGSFSLDNGGGTTTTVTNTRVTASSLVFLQATSDNAAAAVGAAAGVYVSTLSAGTSFTVTHPASPGAGATMNYWIVN